MSLTEFRTFPPEMFLSEELNRKIQNSFQRFVFSRAAYVLKKSIQQLV